MILLGMLIRERIIRKKSHFLLRVFLWLYEIFRKKDRRTEDFGKFLSKKSPFFLSQFLKKYDI